eukprot:COSAG04_NODE_172_length_21594_cov_14.638614_3_plen_67_part_00
MQHSILSIFSLSGTRASLSIEIEWWLRLRLRRLRLFRQRQRQPLLIVVPPLVLLPTARPPLCTAAI